MTNKWSPAVERAMHELSNATPPAPPVSILDGVHNSQRRSRPVMAAAAAALLLVMVAGLILITRRGDDTRIAQVPPSTELTTNGTDDLGVESTSSAVTTPPTEGAPATESSPSTVATVRPSTPVAGEAAVWMVAPAAVTSSTQTFTALVTGLGCSGGVTGAVQAPLIEISDSSIVITFTVEQATGAGRCLANDQVSYDVDIGEPIGRRPLIDGACRPGGDESQTEHCAEGAVRWSDIMGPPRPIGATAGVPAVVVEGQTVAVELQSGTDEPLDVVSVFTLSIVRSDGVPFLQIDQTQALIPSGTEFWQIQINGRVRSITTAHTGSTQGVRLEEAGLEAGINVTVFATDISGFAIAASAPRS